MKMFLTRIGFGSRAVVTGDITQIDRPQGQSGLVSVHEILGGIDGVAFSYLDANDVVRHKIVQQIVEAYRRFAESDHQNGRALPGERPRNSWDERGAAESNGAVGRPEGDGSSGHPG
jgi:phosphate starvation-inducible PhoH-like protein